MKTVYILFTEPSSIDWQWFLDEDLAVGQVTNVYYDYYPTLLAALPFLLSFSQSCGEHSIYSNAWDIFCFFVMSLNDTYANLLKQPNTDFISTCGQLS